MREEATNVSCELDQLITTTEKKKILNVFIAHAILSCCSIAYCDDFFDVLQLQDIVFDDYGMLVTARLGTGGLGACVTRAFT